MNSIQKIGKMQDSITTGLVGGFIGTVFMDISNTLLYKSRKTEGLYGHIAGQMFVAPFRTKQRKNFILGEILHLAGGSIFGIPLFYILKKTGKDHYMSKGLVSSIITWGVLYAGGQKVGLFKKPLFTKTLYSEMFNHLIYGIVSSKAMVTLADPIVFESSNQTNKQSVFEGTQSHFDSNFVGSINNINEQFQQPHLEH